MPDLTEQRVKAARELYNEIRNEVLDRYRPWSEIELAIKCMTAIVVADLIDDSLRDLASRLKGEE